MITTRPAAPGTDVLTSRIPIPGLGTVPVNATGREGPPDAGSADLEQQASPVLDLPGNAELVDVALIAGESYEAVVRGHRVVVDQPTGSGGHDSAPTPVELFVASLASCVAFYAGRYLTRHGYSRDGLAVSAAFTMASDRPARVSDILLSVRVPASLPAERRPALHAVVKHCTVHNTLVSAPSVTIELD